MTDHPTDLERLRAEYRTTLDAYTEVLRLCGERLIEKQQRIEVLEEQVACLEKQQAELCRWICEQEAWGERAEEVLNQADRLIETTGESPDCPPPFDPERYSVDGDTLRRLAAALVSLEDLESQQEVLSILEERASGLPERAEEGKEEQPEGQSGG